MSRGTGYLFAAWVALIVTLALFTLPLPARAQETGSLTAEISWSPNPIYVRTNVTISVQLSNPSNVSIHGISYVIYAGLGNYIRSGSISELKPNESHLLTAPWTPYVPGKCLIGVNASDSNGTCSVAATETLLALWCGEYFFSSNGTMKCILVGLDFLQDSNIGWGGSQTIHLDFQVYSTHPVVVNWSYEIYAGMGNILHSCPQINEGVSANSAPMIGAAWRPTAPGTYKVGINITDLEGDGAIVAYWNLTVGAGDSSSQFLHTLWPARINTVPKTSYYLTLWVSYNGSTPLNISPSVTTSPPGLKVRWGDSPFYHLSLTENQSKAQDVYIVVPERIGNGTYTVTISYNDENGTISANDTIIVNIGNGTPMGQVSITLADADFTVLPFDPIVTCATIAYSGPGDGIYELGFIAPSMDWEISYEIDNTSLSSTFFLTDNASVAREIIVIIPPGVLEGSYTVTVFVKDNVTEIIVAEAVLHVIVRIPPLVADLSVIATDIGLEPDPPTDGNRCTLLVKVRNRGDGKGTGLVRVADSNGTAIGSENISMEPSASLNLSFSWNPTAGNHTVRVTIQTLSGGNRNPDNDNTTRTFQIQAIVTPLPPVPRLSLMLEESDVTLAPGDIIILNLTLKCQGAVVSGIRIWITPSDGLRVDSMIMNPPSRLEPGDSWILKLRISASTLLGNSPRNGTLEISVNGTGITKDARIIRVRINEKTAPQAPMGRIDIMGPAIGIAAAISVVLVAAAVIGGTEVGFVAFFGLFLPLYVKIRKEEVLDQFTRGKIQGYITAYPGEHYNSIKTQLGLNNGVLAYHLRVLEREGFVTSLRDGVYKRFYPKEAPLPKKRGQFSAIQEMIIEHIRDEPGISQDGLARKMKVSNQVIYYHIRTLMAAGAVRLEKSGKETHCHLSDSGDPGSYAGLSF